MFPWLRYIAIGIFPINEMTWPYVVHQGSRECKANIVLTFYIHRSLVRLKTEYI